MKRVLAFVIIALLSLFVSFCADTQPCLPAGRLIGVARVARFTE